MRWCSGRGDRSEFEVPVRPWVAVFLLFNRNAFNNRSTFFKCLKNSSNRIQKGLLRRRQQEPSQVFAAGMPEKLNPSQLRRHTGGDNYQVADDFFLHIGQYPKQ